LAATIRGDIPVIAAEWLAPVAPDFASLTEEREGETDAEFIARVTSFAENIADLYEKLNRESLEQALYEANSEGLLLGIRGRLSQSAALRARRRRKRKALLRG